MKIMITIGELTEFLGWALVINVSFFMLSFLGATFLRTKILQIHSKMFGLCEEDVSRAHFQFMAQYKMALLVFFVAPYLALKLMG